MTEFAPIELDLNVLFRKNNALPALPKMVTRIQEIIHRENVNLGEIEKLISSDPAM